VLFPTDYCMMPHHGASNNETNKRPIRQAPAWYQLNDDEDFGPASQHFQELDDVVVVDQLHDADLALDLKQGFSARSNMQKKCSNNQYRKDSRTIIKRRGLFVHCF